jgi:Fur family transcriptional regulator, ferric uptake regulator
MQGHHRTRQRRLLLQLITETKGHIGAKELYRLASARDSAISSATVYRSLNLFKQEGLIEEKHLGQPQCLYELKGSWQHHHLVCGRCGKVIDFSCPLSETVEKVKFENGFTVTKAEVYFEGYCAECAGKNSSEK